MVRPLLAPPLRETKGRGRRLPPQVFLADREKKILMVVIPLQVVAEVAIIVLDEHTPAAYSWFTWMNILHLVDIVCCCAILFPIVWCAPATAASARRV